MRTSVSALVLGVLDRAANPAASGDDELVEIHGSAVRATARDCQD